MNARASSTGASHADAVTMDASGIDVRTRNGTVQLSGSVRNAHEKASAEEIARGVQGVRDVRNRIEVRR